MYRKSFSILSCVMILSVSFLVVLFASGNTSAVVIPSEYIYPERTIQCDFIDSVTGNKGSGTGAAERINGDPGILTGGMGTTYFETNDSYLYWGNSTSSAEGYQETGFGVGRGVFELTDPEYLPDDSYWQLTVTAWVTGMTFLSPTWTQIGSYGLTSSGIWSAFNLGLILYDDEGSVIHTQMHTSGTDYGYWWTDGDGPVDYPPLSWDRPSTGTNTWDVFTDTTTGVAFTADNIRNMAVVIEVSMLGAIHAYDTCAPGSGLAIAIGGVRVGIERVDYTPPTYSGGFILRPEADLYSFGFTNKTYATDDLYDSMDEDTTGSDHDTSYIRVNWSDENTKHNFVSMSMTDPPDDAPEINYRCYLWFIAKSPTVDLASGMYAGFGFMNSSADEQAFEVYGIDANYKNYTMAIGYTNIPEPLQNPGPWALSTLYDMFAQISIIPASDGLDYAPAQGEVRVSQLAVLCVPYYDEEYFDDIGEINISGLIWLIILFLPALAMNMMIPKYGFIGGMLLMLFVFGSSMDGFYPITIIGAIGSLVVLYKGV